MRFFYPILFCIGLIAVNALPVSENSGCGEWSGWVGECNFDHCGACSVQTRTRDVGVGCEGLASESRNCANAVCLYPCVSCATGCQKRIFGNRFLCSAGPSTPNDVLSPVPAPAGYYTC